MARRRRYGWSGSTLGAMTCWCSTRRASPARSRENNGRRPAQDLRPLSWILGADSGRQAGACRRCNRGQERRVRRRGCLIGIGGVMLALVLCCVLGWFVLLPRFHDAVEREMTTVLSTEVADAIVAQVPGGASVDPGEYRISLAELERRASGGSDNLQIEGVEIRGDGNELVLGFSAGNAGAEYRFTPQAVGGRLELTDMRGD